MCRSFRCHRRLFVPAIPEKSNWQKAAPCPAQTPEQVLETTVAVSDPSHVAFLAKPGRVFPNVLLSQKAFSDPDHFPQTTYEHGSDIGAGSHRPVRTGPTGICDTICSHVLRVFGLVARRLLTEQNSPGKLSEFQSNSSNSNISNCFVHPLLRSRDWQHRLQLAAGASTAFGWVPTAQDVSPSARNQVNERLCFRLITEDEESCRSATCPFWTGHPVCFMSIAGIIWIRRAGIR